MTFSLVVALKTQAVNTVSLSKQIKRSDMVTYLFSVHTITEAKHAIRRAKQGGARAVDLPARIPARTWHTLV